MSADLKLVERSSRRVAKAVVLIGSGAKRLEKKGVGCLNQKIDQSGGKGVRYMVASVGHHTRSTIATGGRNGIMIELIAMVV